MTKEQVIALIRSEAAKAKEQGTNPCFKTHYPPGRTIISLTGVADWPDERLSDFFRGWGIFPMAVKSLDNLIWYP